MEMNDIAPPGASGDGADGSDDVVQHSKNPLEKLRVRLAAENFNRPGSYQTMTDDNDNEQPAGRRKGCSSKVSMMPVAIVFFVLALVLIGFIVVSVLLAVKLASLPDVCRSANCVVIGGEMLSRMNVSVDRCDDFYSYACESFINDVTIPPSAPYYSMLSGTVKRTQVARMRKLLDEHEQGFSLKGSNSSAVSKARQYYASCMNITAIDRRGITPMLKMIKTMGSWPLTSDAMSGVWSNSSWNLEIALNTAHHYRAFPFFAVYVGVDDKNSSSYVVTMDQSGLSLGSYQSYTGNSSATNHKAFVEFFVTVSQLLGADETTAGGFAEETWQLETAIAKAFVSPEKRADPKNVYHMMSVSEVQTHMDSRLIDVRRLLHLMLGSQFDESLQINVRVPEYFKRLPSLMRIASRRNFRTLATYITWTAIVSKLPYMSTPFQQAILQLNMKLYGVEGDSSRWQKCSERTDSVLGFATGALYVERYFSDTERLQVESLFKSVMSSFKSRMARVKWMDEATRATALDKADTIAHKIGYPDFVANPAELDQHYEQFNVTDDNFENALNAAEFVYQRNINKFGTVPDRTAWSMTPAEVNAFYDPPFNQIGIPAGILQRPIYDASFPMSLIYGSIAFIMGHEITHGFDSTGRQYDKHGNLVDWWGNQSAQQFNDLAQCFVDEYDQFTVYGHHLKGRSTLGENIADNGGLQISYDALQTWLKANHYNDALLPGLNMTHSQQFFLSFAQTWCTAYQPKYAIMLIAKDVHSNGRYRVNGVVRNMPEFADAFNCRRDAKLNPSKRCTLW